MWDYAEMSSQAKKAGGPEQYAEQIFESGKEEGREEMMVLIPFALMVGSGLTFIGTRLSNHFKQKRAERKGTLETATLKLAEELQKCDENQPLQEEAEQQDNPKR